MKKLTLWMMALAVLPGSALQAQNITGNWQGTLQAGERKVRIVFKIAPAADNPDAAPDLFAAFQQPLGLKLEPTRAPVDVMVIDKVEKPSEN
jgi:uncharacterized protein (TIGR03435 family)